MESKRVGAEVELLAYDAATWAPLPLLGNRGLVALLRELGARAGWHERRGYGAVPSFDVPGRALITFEPGGQIEISTVPNESVGGVLSCVNDVVAMVRAAVADRGVRLESVGIDWANEAADIPLQLDVERYAAMTRYFDGIGPYGIRMMRQTAAIQVSLDRGPRPAERWRLLNDLAPYLIAIFSNSPHYCRAETGHRSFRAHCWRMLDPTRTGVRPDESDPAGDYTEFALAANDILRSAGDHRQPFAGRFAEGAQDDALDAAWHNHLTTLFPEVRPRGHFEVRSCDAIDGRWYAAPIVFLVGLAYDRRSAAEAAVLAADSQSLLRSAGQKGLRDAGLARTARDLFQLALDGARRLGADLVDGRSLDTAREFFSVYTSRDRSPADDRAHEPSLAAVREPEPIP